MTARKNPLLKWTGPLHQAMRAEIGRQMRSEYELPRELPREIATLLNQLPAGEAAVEECYRRRRRLLQRAMACEEAAGNAINEGIKEIYLDLAGQWRDLAKRHDISDAIPG